MDASVVETLLPTDADVEAVRNEIAHRLRGMASPARPASCLKARRHRGAQDADTLVDAIRQGRPGQGARRVGNRRGLSVLGRMAGRNRFLHFPRITSAWRVGSANTIW
ncbi:hypothetical protein ACVOMV_36605 [Mesorhizobium atlanticum]